MRCCLGPVFSGRESWMRGYVVQETVYSKIRKQVDLGHEFFISFLSSIRSLVAKETGEEIKDIL